MTKFLSISILFFHANLVLALEVHPIFTDNMVLQQGKEIPVWGWAGSGEVINLSIDGIIKTTTTNQDGTWEVLLPPFDLPKSNLQLTVFTKKEKISIENIAIGDVWLCAGQSNMAFQLYRSKNGEKTIRERPQHDIRHYKIKTNYSAEPLETLLPGKWFLNTSEEVKNFTAIGYYFAEKITSEINIPIGLINNAVGGSAIEAWMREECFSNKWLSQYRDSIRKLENTYYQETISKIKYVPKNINPPTIFRDDFSFQIWKNMELPGRWEDKGYKFLDGEIYYAKDILITDPIAKKDSTLLQLSTIDDADSVWVNGHFVGATQQWDMPRQYVFSSQLLKYGTNRILIKVMDTGGSGGVRGSKEDMFLKVSNKKMPLSGNWKFYLNKLQLDSPWKARHQPAMCCNALLYPIAKFPIKGVLWYQGEANANTNKSAREYGGKLQNLIINWRAMYNQPDLPFLLVQLPGYDDPRAESSDTWAILRQSQLEVLEMPNTSCISIIDLDEKNDIHPVYKKEVGSRLADIALNLYYGKKNKNVLNPQLDTFKIVEDGVLLKFKNVGDGLTIKKEYSSAFQNGFVILDKNNTQHIASAKIISPAIVKLEFERTENITEINYLFKNWNEHISLFSKSGLPVFPFKIKF